MTSDQNKRRSRRSMTSRPLACRSNTQALLALTAVNREYDGLVARVPEASALADELLRSQFHRGPARGLLREHRLDPIQVQLMEADLRQINLRKGQAGAAALRELRLDLEAQDYTIDEETGQVFRLVKKGAQSK